LGDHENWKAPWSEKLLNPIGDVEWQYHQHDCSVTPDGNILCFDNGNYRATPFGAKMSDADSYSRAVEFKVNENAMTVQQVWAYGKAQDERLFACYQGGAYRLPQTGNTFITYGGTCTIEGKPSSSPGKSFAQARLIEVTPDNEVVFDMWIDDSSAETPVPLSSFRSEFVPGL
jgi:arylsulfate sulfotransferase